MSNFNEVNKIIITDIINDTFYVEGCSNRGKISKIRQFSEIIIRKILDLSSDEKVTLGDSKIRKQLIQKSNNNENFINALNNIQKFGNDCTHTQMIQNVTDEDYQSVKDSLLDLYAFLFIDYFSKYPFDTKQNIADGFSVLPPIIRYKTLKYLYEKFPNNAVIIDKFSLSILKTFDKKEAISWLNANKENLLNVSTLTEKGKQKIIEQFGDEKLAQAFFESIDKNMYDVCYEKIEIVGNQIKNNGHLYKTFEEASNFLEGFKNRSGNSEAEIEFFSLMDFVYLGRKVEKIDQTKRFKYIGMSIK